MGKEGILRREENREIGRALKGNSMIQLIWEGKWGKKRFLVKGKGGKYRRKEDGEIAMWLL